MGTLTQLENVAILSMDVKLTHLESSTVVIVMEIHVVVGNAATVTLSIA